jgi:hypothetical protein
MGKPINDSGSRRGVLTCDVTLMDTGFRRSAGSTVYETEVTPEMWANWIRDGVIGVPDLPDPREEGTPAKRTARKRGSRSVLE